MAEKLNRIKIVLAEKEVTNRELANKLGVKDLTVSRWVTNRQQPSLQTLYQIADFLDVDICDLLVSNKEK